MIPVKTVAQVFDEIQRAKAGATAFCTNFFPVQSRLQGWIDHGELSGEIRGGVAFFLRQDRGLWHLHFCAPNLPALEQGLASLPELKREQVAVDLVGTEAALAGILDLIQSAGFRPHSRLIRLARPAAANASAAAPPALAVWAEASDGPAVMALLESSFDRYADSLPSGYELDAAIASRQILLVKQNADIGALLFFETQGLTSTVRYWVVADHSRSSGLGSAVIRHYFASQSAVKRFILWVSANNENAIAKYRHYGYAPDGLTDHILVNQIIQP